MFRINAASSVNNDCPESPLRKIFLGRLSSSKEKTTINSPIKHFKSMLKVGLKTPPGQAPDNVSKVRSTSTKSPSASLDGIPTPIDDRRKQTSSSNEAILTSDDRPVPCVVTPPSLFGSHSCTKPQPASSSIPFSMDLNQTQHSLFYHDSIDTTRPLLGASVEKLDHHESRNKPYDFDLNHDYDFDLDNDLDVERRRYQKEKKRYFDILDIATEDDDLMRAFDRITLDRRPRHRKPRLSSSKSLPTMKKANRTELNLVE